MLEIIVLCILSAFICLAIYVWYSNRKQDKAIKSLANSVYNTAQVLDSIATESRLAGELAKVVSEECISLTEKSSATKDLCLGLLENNDRLSKAVELLIKNHTSTSDKVKRIAVAFNKKAKSDKEFLENLQEYLTKEKSSDSDIEVNKPKKILN